LKISDPLVNRFPRFRGPLVLAVVLAACEQGPVVWKDGAREVTFPAAAPTNDVGDERTAPRDARLVLHSDGTPALEPIPSVPSLPSDSTGCPGSFRTAALSSTEIYSVWWSHRGSGRAVLVSARSDDAGGTWSHSVPVDTTDRSVSGCDRPAPAIAADARSGYVHVTYFLSGPDGPGVFFAHSMDRGEMFHSPVPIMYGAHPSATAVAAADDVVVVAFEDPNTERAHIALAVSRTWGHIFSRERPEASGGTATAERPLVALRHPLVAVGWRDRDRSVVARVGTLNK
jgi:hypothetical protein